MSTKFEAGHWGFAVETDYSSTLTTENTAPRLSVEEAMQDCEVLGRRFFSDWSHVWWNLKLVPSHSPLSNVREEQRSDAFRYYHHLYYPAKRAARWRELEKERAALRKQLLKGTSMHWLTCLCCFTSWLTVHVYDADAGKSPSGHFKWTDDEVAALEAGVAIHGSKSMNAFNIICHDSVVRGSFKEHGRKAADLQEKWELLHPTKDSADE